MAKEQLDKKKRKNCSFCADKVETIDYKDAQKYGFGKGYVYTHENPEYKQQFLPDEIKDKKYFEDENNEVKLSLSNRKNTKWLRRFVSSNVAINEVAKSITSVKSAPESVVIGGIVNPEDVELNVTFLDNTTGVISPTKIICDTSTKGAVVATAVYVPGITSYQTLTKEFNISVVEE